MWGVEGAILGGWKDKMEAVWPLTIGAIVLEMQLSRAQK